MSSYGKILFSNDNNTATENVEEVSQNDDVVEKQVEKFDTNYSNDRLQDLYKEFDAVTVDEDFVKTAQSVKADVVAKSNLSAKTKLYISTACIVSLLLLFLVIYNVFVINSMGSSIQVLQTEVASAEYELAQSSELYDTLTNETNIQSELTENGYSQMSSDQVKTINVAKKVAVDTLKGETNWFDAFCNFISKIIGG